MSETIFVSVASYRDDECVSTLEHIFNNADNPKGVYVGVCQQNDMSDDSTDVECVLPNLDIINHIRIIRLRHHEAKGPTWARYLCSTLYNNETYFFQIDSHTKLVKGWDTKCINMMKQIKAMGLSQKPVISHYPAAWDAYGKDDIGVTRLCKSFFNDRGMISFLGAQHVNSRDFVSTPYVTGGFLFCEGKLLKDVPYDPYLDYLFVGEEILHSIRIWTAGYDIYSPNENIAYHEYTRADKPKIWTDKKYTDEQAFEKVKELIGLKGSSGLYNDYKYGLGNQRTLEQYYEFAGIDIKNKTVNKDFCNPEKKEDQQISESTTELIETEPVIETFENTEKLDTGISYYITFIVICVVFVVVVAWYYIYNK